MTTLNHSEKDALIKELKEKLKEMKAVEKAAITTAAELSSHGMGIHKDEKGYYFLVKIKYDVEKNIAAIEKLEPLNSYDYAIALFQAKKYIVEVILAKARGGRYV